MENKKIKPEGKVALKIAEAIKVMEACISPSGRGIYASVGRYEGMFWIRDFAYAGADALRLIGREDVIRGHLIETGERRCRRAYSNTDLSGKIPIVWLEDEKKFLRIKIEQSIKSGKMSFMLQHFLDHDSVENLTPWTKDSEILFLVALLTHGDLLDEEWSGWCAAVMIHAVGYIDRHVQRADGLVDGDDWRDVNTWLGETPLLSNNCFFYHACRFLAELGNDDDVAAGAEDLKQSINAQFWTGTGYRDYLGVDSADTFGQALGVLYDVFPEERYPAVLASFESLHTSRGYLSNDCRPNPTNAAEQELLNMPRMKQSFVIWPFIHGYAILALCKMGRRDLAETAFQEYVDLDGFWEYYDPETGQGYGAQYQMWSAASFLVAADTMEYDVKLDNLR